MVPQTSTGTWTRQTNPAPVSLLTGSDRIMDIFYCIARQEQETPGIVPVFWQNDKRTDEGPAILPPPQGGTNWAM
jgi:hypothetical protein